MRALLEERGEEVYWFIECLTPGHAAASRVALLEEALHDLSASDADPFICLLRGVYQRIGALADPAHESAGRRRSEALTATMRRRSAGPTVADAEYLRYCLPLDQRAAIHLQRLGLPRTSIARVLDIPDDDPLADPAYLAGVIRDAFAECVEWPRTLYALTIGLAKGDSSSLENILATLETKKEKS